MIKYLLSTAISSKRLAKAMFSSADRCRTIIVAAMLMVIFATGTTAQEYVALPVEVSDQKVMKDGKVYYSHVVLERQTLYSISKAYNVTLDDIFDANPGLKENGLKKNAIIMIPMAAEVKEEVAARREEPAKNETAINAEQRNASASVQKIKIHTVRWYETLKDIAEKYNVSESAIIAANNLKDGKIKNRQRLIILTEGHAMESVPDQQETEIAQTEEEEGRIQESFKRIAWQSKEYNESHKDSLQNLDFWDEFKEQSSEEMYSDEEVLFINIHFFKDFMHLSDYEFSLEKTQIDSIRVRLRNYYDLMGTFGATVMLSLEIARDNALKYVSELKKSNQSEYLINGYIKKINTYLNELYTKIYNDTRQAQISRKQSTFPYEFYRDVLLDYFHESRYLIDPVKELLNRRQKMFKDPVYDAACDLFYKIAVSTESLGLCFFENYTPLEYTSWLPEYLNYYDNHFWEYDRFSVYDYYDFWD